VSKVGKAAEASVYNLQNKKSFNSVYNNRVKSLYNLPPHKRSESSFDRRPKDQQGVSQTERNPSSSRKSTANSFFNRRTILHKAKGELNQSSEFLTKRQTVKVDKEKQITIKPKSSLYSSGVVPFTILN
jgi:hypothetical protein